MIARRHGVLALATAWSAALLLATPALASDAPANAPGAFSVTAVPTTVGRAARHAFAPDEPVWIALTLHNPGGLDTTIVVRHREPGGDPCRLVAGFHGTAVSVTAPAPVMSHVSPVHMGAADTVIAEFPLSEHVQVRAAGLVPIACGVVITSPDGDPDTIATTTVVRFGPRLDAAGRRRLEAELNRGMAADQETTRIRVVRSLRAVDPAIALPLLEKALTDTSELVRTEAVVVATDLSANPAAMKLVEGVRRSGDARLQHAAEAESRWQASQRRAPAPAAR